MRYYVVVVQHNKEKNAENRSVPKAFDTLNEAKQAFYEQLGKDMANTTLDWSVAYIMDSDGNVRLTEKWSE